MISKMIAGVVTFAIKDIALWLLLSAYGHANFPPAIVISFAVALAVGMAGGAYAAAWLCRLPMTESPRWEFAGRIGLWVALAVGAGLWVLHSPFVGAGALALVGYAAGPACRETWWQYRIAVVNAEYANARKRGVDSRPTPM